jgi:thiol-disulfide isomerase/thioredoxin
VEMDVRLEPYLIPRNAIAAIVCLQEQEQDKGQPATGVISSTEGPEIGLELMGGFSLRGQLLAHDASEIKLRSAWLGDLIVPRSSIESVSYARKPAQLRYSDWSTKTLASPSWLETGDAFEGARDLTGTVVEDFSLARLRGDSFHLHEHAGKVIVFDFWATWCGPCIQSIPDMLAIMKNYSDEQVVFLGVNSSEGPEAVRDFLTERKIIGFDTLFDYDGQLAKAMDVRGIPHTVVVGPINSRPRSIRRFRSIARRSTKRFETINRGLRPALAPGYDDRQPEANAFQLIAMSWHRVMERSTSLPMRYSSVEKGRPRTRRTNAPGFLGTNWAAWSR